MGAEPWEHSVEDQKEEGGEGEAETESLIMWLVVPE